eukprot:6055448-Prymnesium_polylepis.1
MTKDKKQKDKHKHKDKDKKKHKSAIKKHKHKKHKHKSRKHDSDSDSSSSSSSAGVRRSIVTGEKIKMKRHDDEATRREEARREAIRDAMNGGEGFGTAEPAPMSSIERAVQEKLKDKDSLHKMMLEKAEHAKFQLETGVGLGSDEKRGKKGGFFPDRGQMGYR